MPTNPYEPPKSDPGGHARPPAPPRSPLVAVLLGLAVDVGGSLLVSVVVTILYAVQLHGQGLSEAAMRAALRAMPHDSGLYMTALLLSIGLSVLGGYVCARVARLHAWRAGLMMTASSALFGVVVNDPSSSSGMSALLVVTGIACNLLGVKFGVDHLRRAVDASP
jgi:hypothetical protein